MKAFQYAIAYSTESARQLVNGNGAYLAGGNDLLGLMKEYLATPDVVVNLKSLPGLNKIEHGPHGWRIGALVTIAQLETDAHLSKAFQGLHEAASEIASSQIRNVATVGGNLAQHSRCWYFRHRDVPCLKKHGETCYARIGDNRYHSLFSGTDCISPVVSSLASIFAALNAAVVVLRDGRELRWTIAEFYAEAWKDSLAHNSLQPGDLILRIEIPSARKRSSYVQSSEKHAFDWALVNCAVAADIVGGRLISPRVVLGSVSPMPHEASAANEFLEGKELNDDVAAKAADLLLVNAKPLESNAYKVPIAHALIRRSLMKLKGVV